MLIYRITLAKFADKLQASGRAARWNSNEVEMIYASSSQSLACLENVVHRNQLGLNTAFNVLSINIPDEIRIIKFNMESLPNNWKEFNQVPITQRFGDEWIKRGDSLILMVPSSIINKEYNYLINPAHPDFSKIKILSKDPFVFDERIKR